MDRISGIAGRSRSVWKQAGCSAHLFCFLQYPCIVLAIVNHIVIGMTIFDNDI